VTKRFPLIKDAGFFVQIDGGADIPVDVYLADEYETAESSDPIGSLRGSGDDEFDLSVYGYGTDLVFVYRRPGWIKDSEERVKLEEPNQVFRFSVGANLGKCMELQKSGRYEAACRECEKISASSSDYCDSRNAMITMYEEKLSQNEKALKSCLEYVDNTGCGENFRYNLRLFSLSARSTVSKVPKKFRDPDKLKSYYDRTIILITVGVSGKGKTKYANQLSGNACDYGIKLMKHYVNESKRLKGKAAEFRGYNEDLRYMIQDWMKKLPASQRKDISKRLAKI
jgi:hypothetical protein